MPSPLLSYFSTHAIASSSVIGLPPPGRVKMPEISSYVSTPLPSESNAANAARSSAAEGMGSRGAVWRLGCHGIAAVTEKRELTTR